MRDIIFAGDIGELEKLLAVYPHLAFEDVALPGNIALAHPPHRICDAVFQNCYSEETGRKLAEVFIKYGASVNIDPQVIKDSPLTAACSLRCDDLALFYIEHGASIDHRGCHGGTALHWSAWCGRDKILRKLMTMNPAIDQRCIDFKSTPLFWAIHGYKFGGLENRHHQIDCARILLENGADASIPNFEGYLPAQLSGPNDNELFALFNS